MPNETEDAPIGLHELVAHKGHAVRVPLAGLLARKPALADPEHKLTIAEWEKLLDEHARTVVDRSAETSERRRDREEEDRQRRRDREEADRQKESQRRDKQEQRRAARAGEV